jgi:hypothetical protein
MKHTSNQNLEMQPRGPRTRIGALRHRRLLPWTHAWTSTKSDSLTSGQPPPHKKAGFTWPPRITCTASRRHNDTAMPAPRRSLPRTWSTRTSRWAWKTKPNITARLLEIVASSWLESVRYHHTFHPNRPPGLFGCLHGMRMWLEQRGSSRLKFKLEFCRSLRIDLEVLHQRSKPVLAFMLQSSNETNW